MYVISLCDYSGNMVRPWANAGYPCYCIDLAHETQTTQGNITFIPADVLTWRLPKLPIKIVFAFPPCTDLAISGARYFQQKGLTRLIEALKVVDACRLLCERSNAPYMIENPVSTLSTYWRKPDYIFQPYEYGNYLNPPVDGYQKKTCLWVGNGFAMPEKKPTEITDKNKLNNLPQSTDRARLRSNTPMGFAQAVFEANQ